MRRFVVARGRPIADQGERHGQAHSRRSSYNHPQPGCGRCIRKQSSSSSAAVRAEELFRAPGSDPERRSGTPTFVSETPASSSTTPHRRWVRRRPRPRCGSTRRTSTPPSPGRPRRGASRRCRPQDMFWGDRMATVIDKWGNRWNLATHIKDPHAGGDEEGAGCVPGRGGEARELTHELPRRERERVASGSARKSRCKQVSAGMQATSRDLPLTPGGRRASGTTSTRTTYGELRSSVSSISPISDFTAAPPDRHRCPPGPGPAPGEVRGRSPAAGRSP